ncbi:protein GrpE, partial [Striga asiatica]
SQMKKKEPRRKTPPAQNLNTPPAYTQTETAPPVAPQSAMKQPIRKSPRLTQTEPALNDHRNQIHKERNLVGVVAVLMPVEVAHIEELVEVAEEGLEVAEVTPLALKKVQPVSSMDVWFVLFGALHYL